MRMLDSIDVAHLPDGADAYAGYTTGLWPTWKALKTRFEHHAHLLSIAITASEHALCLDIEKGDADPWQAPDWVKAEHARNVHRPVLYASVSKMHRILVLLSAHGITRAQVRLWSAHYGAGKHICGPATCKQVDVGMDGTQWTDAAAGNGANVDESLLAADFFHTAPAPVLDGFVVTQSALLRGFVGRAVTSHDGGKTWT